MTPYTTLETLTAFAGVVLLLLMVSLLTDVLIAVWKRGQVLRHTRTTVEDRRERLLKLIASTDRSDRRN